MREELEKELSKNLIQTLLAQAADNDTSWLCANSHLILSGFQDLAHETLRYFLEGSFLSRRSRALFPFLIEYDSGRLNHFREQLEGLISCWRLAGRETEGFAGAASPLKTEKEFLDVLAHLYQFLDREIGHERSRVKSPIEIEGLKPERLEEESLRRWMAKLEKKMAAFASVSSGFYLMGSLADGQWIPGYSDVDTVIILRRETVFSSSKLLRARKLLLDLWKLFFAIDPVQHHGVHYLTEVDLDFYPQSYLPFCLFEQSVAIGAARRLLVCERDSSLERENRRYQMEQVIRRWTKEKIAVPDLYTWKALCQYWMLYPLIALQAKGHPIYKRKFFDYLYEEGVTRESWEHVSRCRAYWSGRTSNRPEWKMRHACLRSMAPIINVFLLQYISQHLLFRKIPGWAELLVSEKDIHHFSNDLQHIPGILDILAVRLAKEGEK